MDAQVEGGGKKKRKGVKKPAKQAKKPAKKHTKKRQIFNFIFIKNIYKYIY